MFTTAAICDGLGIIPGQSRERVANALGDFRRRGEVTVAAPDRRGRPRYRYNPHWRPKTKGTLNKRVYKAMYVSASFATADLERLVGGATRNHIEKIVRRLAEQGMLTQTGRRPCIGGAGVEAVWRIVDRDRFRREVMA